MPTKSYWQRYQRARISRRRLLGAAGMTAAGAAAVAACGDGGGNGNGNGTDATAAPTQPAGAPVRGGTLKLSVTADWGTLDPLVSVASGPAAFARVYNALLDRSRLDPNFFFMDIAEEYEQPTEEEYTFTLRPNVMIPPNELGIPERALDSSDLQAWLDRIAEDPEACGRAFTEPWIASYEAPSANEFTIRTNGPYAYFLFRIGPPLCGTIPPKEFFEQAIGLEDQGVGAGPWGIIQPGSVSEQGQAVLQRNPSYYMQGEDGLALPYIDTIEFSQITDRQTRRTAFIDRQIHEYVAEDADEKDELVDQLGDVTVSETPANTFISVTMNPTEPPWDDARLRMAMNFALNRQEYVDRIVGPEGGQINGLVHWSTGDFALPPEELEELQPYDPDRARSLIQEATGNDTINIPIIFPISDIEFHDKHLPIFRQQMERAGFNLEEDALDFGTWLDRYTRVDYVTSLSLNQIYETPEIPLDFQSAQGPQGDGNFAIGLGAVDEEVEAAITASKTAANPEEHVQLVRDAQRLIYERGPTFLPIMTWVSFTLRHGFLKNVTTGLGGTGLYLTREWWLDQ